MNVKLTNVYSLFVKSCALFNGKTCRTLYSTVNLEHLKFKNNGELDLNIATSRTDDSITDLKIWNSDIEGHEEDKLLIADHCNEDVSLVTPYFQPSYNFAAYVNKSPTLQELVKLGVNLHQLEKKEGVMKLILQLDFEHIKDYIRFLHDKGVPLDNLGSYFTRNPYIFKEDLDNLQVRINYLQSKNFTNEMITRVIQQNPHWLSFSTGTIDSRLGFFQTTFSLSGTEVRTLTTKQPRLITYDLSHVKKNTFTVKEEMGFSDDEMKTLLLKKPRLWIKSNRVFLAAFDYVHNIMKLPHEEILDFPEILCSRVHRIKQRHLFLKSLGRAQYNRTLEGYISPKRLVSYTDTEFCQTVAKSSVESFNIFLKSI